MEQHKKQETPITTNSSCTITNSLKDFRERDLEPKGVGRSNGAGTILMNWLVWRQARQQEISIAKLAKTPFQSSNGKHNLHKDINFKDNIV